MLSAAKRITKKLGETYTSPGTVYPYLGNHVAYQADQFDFIHNQDSWLLEESGEIWSQFLTPAALSPFKKHGYYTQLDRETSLRIIALNCLLYDTMNFYKLINSTDPYSQLAWLNSTLYEAEANNESVYIVSHLPPCCGFVNVDFGHRYGGLVERYENIIKGQFHGHTHWDQFTIFMSKDAKHGGEGQFEERQPVGVALVGGAVTSHEFLNPSFRVYEGEREEGQYALRDYL